LETLRFRSDNRFQPVIEALAAIQRNLTTHQEHFSEQVPIEGVVTPRWKEKVFEQVKRIKYERLYAGVSFAIGRARWSCFAQVPFAPRL
jgi:hypothetical protein